MGLPAVLSEKNSTIEYTSSSSYSLQFLYEPKLSPNFLDSGIKPLRSYFLRVSAFLSTMYSFQKKVYGWKIGALGEDFDDVYIGHFHTPTKMTFNTIQMRISGSPESTNTYASESLAAIGRPSQPLMFVHPEKGIVTAEYNCWLDK